MLTFLLNILSVVTGLTTSDIFGIVFIISFILMIISIVYLLRQRSKDKKNQPAKAQIAKTKDETQFWVCPNCGGNTEMKDSRQYCPSCKIYLSI